MKLKLSFIVVLMCSLLLSCTNQPKENSEAQKADSIRRADSVAKAIEEQRIIDSVNMVTNEQQIIADSIMQQFEN